MNPPIITYTHTFNDENVITGRRVAAFYSLPDGCASYADVPIGSQFDIVIVPVDKQEWRATTIQVTWNKYDKVDVDYCRYYKPIASRTLEADEMAMLMEVME